MLILDCGWEITQKLDVGGWLNEKIRIENWDGC